MGEYTPNQNYDHGKVRREIAEQALKDHNERTASRRLTPVKRESLHVDDVITEPTSENILK